VQTVTYPRARDIALMARHDHIEVLAGGVHLSAHGPSVEFSRFGAGCTVAIGEVEPIWDTYHRGCARGATGAALSLSSKPISGLRVKSAMSYRTRSRSSPDVPFLTTMSRARLRHYVNPSQAVHSTGRAGCPFLSARSAAIKYVFGRTVAQPRP
jgi:hypothetical protein